MKYSLLVIITILSQLPLVAQTNTSLITHKRQFRGVWIATVRNLDWPSKPGLSVGRQKREYIKLLDKLKEIGMNVVIVQVRPTADSFYPSEYEPWSEFLSGKQGVPPPSSFDPLAFMIAEAHLRSMEFHAWFNPYRAVRNIADAELSSNHVYHQHPEWFVTYGKDAYFDPGMVPARKFVEKVIADVVTRYDIDGVHFDDYYYPYRIEGVAFPDTLSFSLYPREFTEETKDDWRRDNINRLVKELSDTINYLKPWVHFGISPFGVWRNKSQDPDGSDTHTLQTNYDDLFGDSRAWVKNGWLDYILPQCYQYMGREVMDYRVLTRWWNDHNYGVNFYIGQGPFRLGNSDRGEPWTSGNEIARQLHFNDSITNLLGSAYFRAQTFFDNPLGINDSLKNTFYKHNALPPASHHDADRVFDMKYKALNYKVKRKKVLLSWQAVNPEEVRYYIIYKSANIGNPENIITITSANSLTLRLKPLGIDASHLIITAVDRYRIESQPIRIVEE